MVELLRYVESLPVHHRRAAAAIMLDLRSRKISEPEGECRLRLLLPEYGQLLLSLYLEAAVARSR